MIALLVVLTRVGVFTFTADGFSRALDYVLVGVTIAFFVWLFAAGNWTPDERRRLVVIVVLFLGAAVFWSAFEQAGSLAQPVCSAADQQHRPGIHLSGELVSVGERGLHRVASSVAAWVWVNWGAAIRRARRNSPWAFSSWRRGLR